MLHKDHLFPAFQIIEGLVERIELVNTVRGGDDRWSLYEATVEQVMFGSVGGGRWMMGGRRDKLIIAGPGDSPDIRDQIMNETCWKLFLQQPGTC